MLSVSRLRRRESNDEWPRKLLCPTFIILLVFIVTCTIIVFTNAPPLSDQTPSHIGTDISHVQRLATEASASTDDFFYIIPNGVDPGYCSSGTDVITLAMEQAATEGTTKYVSFEGMTGGASQGLQVCFGRHAHQHTIDVKIVPSNTASDCDMYVSASNPNPSSLQWDWKSTKVGAGEESLRIMSYAKEFLAANLNTVFISIYAAGSRETRHSCTAYITVSRLSTTELLHKVGSLRGGQILLPRDLQRMGAAVE
jgi:hypothetical protein